MFTRISFVLGAVCALVASVVTGTGHALAANGDLLASSDDLLNKEITGICADADGTFWAVGETSGKIYHLDAALAKIGEIPNPHPPGTIPNLVLSRGISFRPSTGTLLVLGKDKATYLVKEIDRTGVEVPDSAFTIDTSTLTNPNLYGFAFDPATDQAWMVDDLNDQVICASTQAPFRVLNAFSFPGDVPGSAALRGTGISFLKEVVTPYIHISYGDLFTLAPGRIVELTVTGLPTGAEVPLGNVPPYEAGKPVQKIGPILVGTFGDAPKAIVVGEKGRIHVLEWSRPSPVPPSFFAARLTTENQVALSWINHGEGMGGSYPGGLVISRNGQALPNGAIHGARSEFVDDSPPAEGTVTYAIQGSNGGAYSPSVEADVVVGKGGLIRWFPFPGTSPFDSARDPSTGTIYVTDTREGKIYLFDKNMIHTGEIPCPLSSPGGIAFNPAGNGGAGSLMAATTDGTVMQEMDLSGVALDARIPIDFRPIESPEIGGLVFNPATGLYTCVEISSRQLFTFNRNGQQQAVCTPPDLFEMKRLSEGVGFDPLTGIFFATFEGVGDPPGPAYVGELYSNCNVTDFSFDLRALGESSYLPDFVQGIEVVENTLVVCGAAADAIFQVLIIPQGKTFIRGDANGDGKVDLSDAVMIANYLFKAGGAPDCLDAADTNDDGEIDISDPVYPLFHLFMGGPEPPDPFPEPGNDPTFLDNLEC
jgi:DNA-binding beta-propeller fold protein YncE